MNVTGESIMNSKPRIPLEVRALLAALQLSQPDMAPLNKLSDEQWESLLSFSDLSHLTLAIAQLPTNEFPQWVVERLATNVSDNALRFERIKATYQEAAAALDRAGIAHMVIKGFTQSPEYVMNPRLRAQSDLDIVCTPENIEAARDALYSVGYQTVHFQREYCRADHIPTLVKVGPWNWKGNHFDPEMPLGIELHFCLWNQGVSRIDVPEAALFFDRRITRELSGMKFPCLNRVDHLGHLALHILRNLLLPDWIIHHVFELARFLHSHADDETFWQQWHELHSPALRSYQAFAFYYAHAWFDCRLNPLAASEIDKLPKVLRSWLQYFQSSPLESMFHRNRDSVWLHIAVVGSSKEKWGLLKQALIPTSIGSTKSIAVHVRNRKIIEPSTRPRWQQYIAYLINRTWVYGYSAIVTLTRGLGWYMSRIFRS